VRERSDQREPASWEADGAGQQFPLRDYLQLLWFRKKMILAITIFVSVVGYIQVSEIKNVYSATSTMLVGLPESRVVDIEEVLRSPANTGDAAEQVEVLRSRELAAKVIERLNLLNHPEFNPALGEPEESLFDFLRYLNPRTWIPQSWKQPIKEALGIQTAQAPPVAPSPGAAEEERQRALLVNAVNLFLGKLSVVNPEWTMVINVTFSSLDRELAARVANDVPEAYIVDKLEARFEATEKANAWLMEQLQDLEAKVSDSERAVEIYRDLHGLAASEGGSILDAQLSELNSQLIIARAERAEIEARLEQLRRLQAGGGQSVETSSEVLASTLVQQLRAQEAQALGRLSELSVEYGPKHPRMLQVQSEIEEVRKRILDEVGRIVVALENEAEFARTRVASLESSLREAQGQTSEQNKEAIQLRALQREAAANRALYETFLNRFKETSSTQGMETTDARIISYAEVPGGPSYPNRRQMQLQYVLIGFFGACAWC
jgi:uncharacterized protein involved in exopolysaccharide biosynthesis